MPTPSDTTRPSAPTEPLSRTSFTSCPPDEREHYDSRTIRSSVGDEAATTERSLASDEHTITRQESHVAGGDNPILDESEPDLGDRLKVQERDDLNTSSDSASTAASPEGSSDHDEGLVEPDAPPVQPAYYLDHLSSRLREPSTTTSFLRPGSRFHGTQRSDRQVYDVQVEIKDVDLAESFLCGYLRIQGLTDDHPTLTTFFEGEIIGPKYLFKTTHPTWGSTEKVDLQHWARFPAWRPLARSAKSPNFTLKNFQQREHLFMRWKEYFLVPDHRVKTITGASFEGFYYICFNQRDGRVSGIYFHAKSEKYQQLELQHIEDHGCRGAMEFR